MPALEAGHAQLLFAGLALALTAGDGGSPVGAAALDLVQAHLARLGIGQAHDDHAVVQQRRVEGQDGALLATVLGGAGREHRAHLADERTRGPQAAGLVDERAHLAADVAEARGRAEDDGVVVRQLRRLRHRGGLVGLAMGRSEYVSRHGFRHTLDVHGGTGHFAGAFGHDLGHLLDVTVVAVIENEDLGHLRLLWGGFVKG